jgi:hypothetical protein
MYFNVFENIWVYLNVFIVYLNVFECTYSVFMVYLNVFVACFNVFQCIWKYLNVFINIVIGISPSYSHWNVFVMRIHIHICFSLSTITTLHNIYYNYTLFTHFHWFVSTFIQSMEKLHVNLYFSRLYIIPHPTFHVVIVCGEHSKAQVYIYICIHRKF